MGIFRHRQDPEPRDGLEELLGQWRSLEPRPGFEEAVWARLRARPAVAPVTVAPASWARPAWLAAAAGIGILLGAGVATATVRTARPAETAHADLLGPGTVAGAYLAMSNGDTP